MAKLTDGVTSFLVDVSAGLVGVLCPLDGPPDVPERTEPVEPDRRVFDELSEDEKAEVRLWTKN